MREMEESLYIPIFILYQEVHNEQAFTNWRYWRGSDW